MFKKLSGYSGIKFAHKDTQKELFMEYLIYIIYQQIT